MNHVCAAVPQRKYEYVDMDGYGRDPQPVDVECWLPLGHPGDHVIDPKVYENRQGGWRLEPRDFRWRDSS